MAQALAQKNWYEIVAPDLFDEQVITETPAEESEQVIGRTIQVALNTLMDTKKHQTDVFLRVTDVDGNKAFTACVGHEVAKEFISRMVRKRSARVDVVEDIETDDGETVRVKIVAVTLKQPKKKTETALRGRIAETVREAAEHRSTDELFTDIFTGALQQELKSAAKEIYPLRSLEFRRTERDVQS